MKLNLKEFLKKYPNDEACLDEIYQKRYPQGVDCRGCKRLTPYYKLKGRNTYSCGFCGTQLSPLTNTIFEKSSVSLRLWFYAIFLMIKTRSGISAKQLERELGVCYKTAHRMFKQIRKLMQEEPVLMDGNVEVDETFVGGKGRNRATKPNFNEIPKEVVWGAIQRGGKVYAKHTDTIILQSITGLLNTSEEIHTNNIENVWSQLKRGIIGVYRHVSKEYLQDYINEYSFRYNYRNLGDGMFDLLLNRVSVVKPA